MSNLFNKPDNLVDMVRQIISGEPIEEKKKQEELDPVGKEDDDVDNDGDVDSSDKYLKKRRKAISKALNEKEPKKKINASHCEEVELDENYRKAALKGIGAETANSIKVGTGVDYYSPKDGSKHMGKITRMDKNGYEVKDDKTGKTFKFKYYSKDAMKEETLDEAKHEDGDGEKMTDAQKKDMDGDGDKEKVDKKKKKKKDDEGESEEKPDKVDTEPEKDDVKTMMSEREMTEKEKAKLEKLKKKYEGGEMHKSMKDQYGEKADAVFYGKLTKMAMGEEIDFNESKYNKDAVDKAIKRDPRIKGKEAKMIHRLLKGRTGKKEETDLGEDDQELGKISKELDGASKMHKGQADRIRKMIKKDDVKEANDEEKDTNLIMQLRKAVSLRGNKVKFGDGKSVVVSDKDAQKFMGMFSKLKKPAEKEMLMKSAAKSHKHFMNALAGKVEKPKSGGLDLPKMKSEK